MKLTSLQKRVHFIQHVLGGWKPSAKYPTLTAQVEQVQRVLEILDSDKISFYMKRVGQLADELDYMYK